MRAAQVRLVVVEMHGASQIVRVASF